MRPGRLEAFSDGVIAILITIMVLELKTPDPGQTDWTALRPLILSLCWYALSFVFLGIYWNNHHHMLQLTERINGGILWANLHLLFWLSLVPFTTTWVGRTALAPLQTALYGAVLLLSGAAYTVLQSAIIAEQGPGSKLKAAVGGDVKGKLSVAIYAAAIALAFENTRVSAALYVVVALMWLVPDSRIESRMRK